MFTFSVDSLSLIGSVFQSQFPPEQSVPLAPEPSQSLLPRAVAAPDASVFHRTHHASTTSPASTILTGQALQPNRRMPTSSRTRPEPAALTSITSAAPTDVISGQDHPFSSLTGSAAL